MALHQPTTASLIQGESAYGKAFQIHTSNDNATWPTIYSTTGTGGAQALNVSGSGRYIRLYGTARGADQDRHLRADQRFDLAGRGGQAGAGTPSRTITGKTRSVFFSYSEPMPETLS